MASRPTMLSLETGEEHSRAALDRLLTLILAGAAGTAVATIYFNQPLLALIGTDVGPEVASWVPTVTQLGYALGIFLVLPLGDLLERRRLIVTQFLVLSAALAVVALAPGGSLLILASLLLGASATVAQQVVTFAAHLAPPEKRGRVVGTVMAGLLGGILLSRTVSGFVGAHAGWRAIFWLAAPVAVVAAACMRLRLPVSRRAAGLTYRGLLGSLGELWTTLPTLRSAALTQALLFAGFTAFWTVLALRLDAPGFGLGADAAGLFGVIGAVGIVAAPAAGRMADRWGPRQVIAGSAVLTIAAWLVLGVWTSLAGLAVGAVVLDLAVQGALVSNQHVIYALRPEARARLNTLFMGAMFLGGAAGSALAAAAWRWGDWTAVCLMGAALSAAAITLDRRARIGRRQR